MLGADDTATSPSRRAVLTQGALGSLLLTPPHPTAGRREEGTQPGEPTPADQRDRELALGGGPGGPGTHPGGEQLFPFASLGLYFPFSSSFSSPLQLSLLLYFNY